MDAGDFDEDELARRVGRYVLENSEHVDVLIARSVSTVQAVPVAFEDVWSRRQTASFRPGVDVALPSLDDLILTNLFGARQRDLADTSLLESLKRRGGA